MINIYKLIDDMMSKNDNDYYIVFSEILVNYKKYNYSNIDECKSNLIMIFEDNYDKEIDENRLNDYLKDSFLLLNRNEQEKFRNGLIKKYKKCVITLKILNFD